MTVTGSSRSPFSARGLVRLEERVLAFPQSVGLVRMLGLVGLLVASAQLLAWPFLGAPASTTLYGVLIAAIGLGCVGLLLIPARALTRTTSSLALVAALLLQTGTAGTTGDVASPFLAGYVGLVLTVALFSSVRMTLVMVVLTVLALLALALSDLDLSASDAANIGTDATICVLVG